MDKINNELNSLKGDPGKLFQGDYREASETEMGLASMKNERLRLLGKGGGPITTSIT